MIRARSVDKPQKFSQKNNNSYYKYMMKTFSNMAAFLKGK